MKLIFDIETNGLFPDKIWCLVAQEISTKEIFSFSDYDDDLPSLQEGLDLLSNARILAGHNIIGFDLVILKRLLGWTPSPETTIWDTLTMSQLNMYDRGHRHGLAGWGQHFNYEKLEFDDWDKYSREMLTYCIRDVELNTKVYERVSKEASFLMKTNPKYLEGLRLEHDVAAINAEISEKGWVFDKKKALALQKELRYKMEAIEDEIEPMLGKVCMMRGTKAVDKITKKNGQYYKTVCDWMAIDENVKASEGFVMGPFSRIEFKEVRLGQMAEVKKFLLDIGWEPDDWTVKNINGNWIKQSPKLTETSLSKLGDIGNIIGDYYMMRNRLATVEGWLETVEEGDFKDGRLHGNMFTMGTPSFRCRHSVIVNIPSVSSDYGKELRSLLTCEEGYKVVGADSAGNQFRGLCHYMQDEDFTSSVIEGKSEDGTDIHSRNAAILGISRPKAKNFIYAYLFGAGPAKLGEVISGVKSAKVGKKADEAFKKAFPGLQALKDDLQQEYTLSKMKTGIGFITGADGRRIILRSDHQALNYLLQTLESITCKAALVYAYNKIKEEGIDAYPVLFYHDEVAFVSKEEYAPRVLEICAEAFKEAPKQFGVMCMDGDGTIGDSYADVH